MQTAGKQCDRLTNLGSRACSARFPFLVFGFCTLVSAPVVFIKAKPQAYAGLAPDVGANLISSLSLCDSVSGATRAGREMRNEVTQAGELCRRRYTFAAQIKQSRHDTRNGTRLCRRGTTGVQRKCRSWCRSYPAVNRLNPTLLASTVSNEF